MHFINTSFASVVIDKRDLCGFIIRPDWLKTLSLAAELHGAEKSSNAIGRRLLANEGSLNILSLSALLFIDR